MCVWAEGRSGRVSECEAGVYGAQSQAVSGSQGLKAPANGLHAFRRGCNRRWELAGIEPTVMRQQMDHTSTAMTRLYLGSIPIEQVSRRNSVQRENMENEAAT
jgi:hypothetical protein